jgi:hypothetical protein
MPVPTMLIASLNVPCVTFPLARQLAVSADSPTRFKGVRFAVHPLRHNPATPINCEAPKTPRIQGNIQWFSSSAAAVSAQGSSAVSSIYRSTTATGSSLEDLR